MRCLSLAEHLQDTYMVLGKAVNYLDPMITVGDRETDGFLFSPNASDSAASLQVNRPAKIFDGRLLPLCHDFVRVKNAAPHPRSLVSLKDMSDATRLRSLNSNRSVVIAPPRHQALSWYFLFQSRGSGISADRVWTSSWALLTPRVVSRYRLPFPTPERRTSLAF